MIRVVIADDHTIVREGLRQLLQAAGDFDVVGEARDGLEALQLARKLEFDVLLLDISMPGRSGMELIKQIRSERPRVRIMVLSMHQEHQYAVRAIRAGASGYLTKESASRELGTALRKVASGGAYITPEVAEQLALGAMPQSDAPPHTTLSDREFQVLRLLVSGQRGFGDRPNAQPVGQDGQHPQSATDAETRGREPKRAVPLRAAPSSDRRRFAALASSPHGVGVALPPDWDVSERDIRTPLMVAISAHRCRSLSYSATVAPWTTTSPQRSYWSTILLPFASG